MAEPESNLRRLLGPFEDDLLQFGWYPTGESTDCRCSEGLAGCSGLPEGRTMVSSHAKVRDVSPYLSR